MVTHGAAGTIQPGLLASWVGQHDLRGADDWWQPMQSRQPCIPSSLSQGLVDYAEELVKLLPEPLQVSKQDYSMVGKAAGHREVAMVHPPLCRAALLSVRAASLLASPS